MQNILIVEDDRELLEQLVKASEEHFRVLASSNIKDSIKIIKTEKIDGLISDYLLPDGTANDLLNEVGTLNTRPKILIMTAHAQKKMVIDFLNKGVNGFIEKPFSKESFQDLIFEHFKKTDLIKRPVLCDVYRKITIEEEVFNLTDIEYQIITFFFTNTGKWVQRKEIINALWGDSAVSRNILDTHLSNLKNKIPYFRATIHNLRGRGYIYE